MTSNTLGENLRSEEEAREYWRANSGKPYIIEINSQGKTLYYYGTYGHFYQVDHPMLLDVEKRFNEWLETSKEPRIVLVEGGTRKPPTARTEAMQQGEAVFTSWLAESRGLEHLSPEVPESRQRELLLAQGFSEDEIQYYFFAICVNQYWDMNTKEPFEEYIMRYLDSDFSLTHMYELHKQYWGRDFSIDPEFGIIEADSPIREIVDAAGVIRDVGIVEEIQDYWDEGYSMFIVFGGSHAVIQEPILQKL
jgi:hypothetical protein